MYDITLIATTHSENGYCNSNELYQAIEEIKPEVIFEELSSNGFSAIYYGTRNDSLESKTIKRYFQKYPITHIPVDLDGNELIDLKLKNDIKEMFNVFYNNIEYQELDILRGNLSYKLGFPYLNSDHCKDIMEKSRILEDKILRMLNHRKLFVTYRKWLEIIDMRENEMMNNIYNYSMINKYNRALFLIGAEHRKPIIKLISKLEKSNSLELKWNFNYFNKP